VFLPHFPTGEDSFKKQIYLLYPYQLFIKHKNFIKTSLMVEKNGNGL